MEQRHLKHGGKQKYSAMKNIIQNRNSFRYDFKDSALNDCMKNVEKRTFICHPGWSDEAHFYSSRPKFDMLLCSPVMVLKYSEHGSYDTIHMSDMLQAVKNDNLMHNVDTWLFVCPDHAVVSVRVFTALLAYTYTMGFNVLSLITCILSAWVKKQKPSPLYSFGYERFEVLAVFGSTVLAQLASVFIIKESIERLILEQTQIHTGRLLVGMGLAFLIHLLVIYGVSNAALEHVIAASSSSWLQEHVSDISQSVCSFIPALSTLLLPRINPMVLIASTGALLIFFTDLLIEMRNYHMADTFAAILIAVMMCATMLPMSIYTGKVLLQTTPSYVIGQLDKCLRESLTIDGVLEFRNEHFWTLSFGKMAGSLHVRVRRDADEQLVLAHIVDKLSNVVSELTVQVFKDEWTLRRGVNNIAPLLPMPNSVPQQFHLNDVSYSRTNSAANGKNARVPHGNWVDATALPNPSNSYSSRLLIPHGATAQTVRSPIPLGKNDNWSNMGNTTNVASNYNINAVPATQSVQRIERQANFNTYEPNYATHSLPLTSTSTFQNVDQTRNPLGAVVGATLQMNHSPQKTNPFLQEIPVSMVTNPQNVRNNNLLLSGTSMLDSDKFVYRPH